MSDRSMTLKEAAAFLGIKEGTLRNWRCKRIGPPGYQYNARKIMYREKELRLWMEQHRQDFDPEDDT